MPLLRRRERQLGCAAAVDGAEAPIVVSVANILETSVLTLQIKFAYSLMNSLKYHHVYGGCYVGQHNGRR